MSDQPWARVVLLADMNAFFAAVEQLDNPQWRGRALALTNRIWKPFRELLSYRRSICQTPMSRMEILSIWLSLTWRGWA